MVQFNIVEKLSTECDVELTNTLERIITLGVEGIEHDWATLMGQEGMEALCRWAFGRAAIAPSIRHLAQRALGIILQSSQTPKQLFLDGGFVQPLVALAQSDSALDQDRVLCMFLLLICCADSDLDLSPYLEKDNLAKVINDRIVAMADEGHVPLHETSLALIMAIGRKPKSAAQSHRFLDSWPQLIDMFMATPMTDAPMGEPLKQLTECMSLIPYDGPFSSRLLDKLVDVVEMELMASHDARPGLEQDLMPVVKLLGAAATHREARPGLFARLMPTDIDRQLPLGRGITFPHVLLRHAAELRWDVPMPLLAKLVSRLMFLLSDEDPCKLLTNVGLGNGAVMFHLMGIEGDIRDAGLMRMKVLRSDVNEVTGQLTSAAPAPGKETPEEKLYHDKRYCNWFAFAFEYGQMLIDGKPWQGWGVSHTF